MADAEKKKLEADKKKKSKGNVSRVWKMHEGDSFFFFVGTIGAILVGAANPSVGIIFVKGIWAFFIDDPDLAWSEAVYWSTWMFVVASCQILGDTMRGYGFGVPGEKLTVKLRMMFYKAIARQEIGWHDMSENNSGSLCAALATEVNLISSLSGEAMGRNVLFVCTLAAAFALAFAFGYWAIVLVAIATVPIMMSGMAIEIAMMLGSESAQGLGVDAGRIVGEAVMSVRTIASFTLEQRMADLFSKATDQFLNDNVKAGAFNGVYQGYSQFSLFSALALLYWYGGSKIADNTTDFEGMLIPIFCMFMLGSCLVQAASGAIDSAKAADAADRVFEVVDRPSKIDWTTEQGQTIQQVLGSISIKNVFFAYPSRPDQRVCNGYNLEIAAGTTVALV